jgi:PilZ domain
MPFSATREQRKEQRGPAPAVGLVDVFMEVSRHKVRLGPSLLQDASPSGLAIQMDQAVAVGKVLHLKNRYVRYAAQVRNCRAANAGFRIGLALLPEAELVPVSSQFSAESSPL